MADIKALSVDEVAERLGYGKAHIYKLIKNGDLQAINLSSGTKQPRFKVDSEDLEKFINSRKNG
jgi:excisionase family DNA binding protein